MTGSGEPRRSTRVTMPQPIVQVDAFADRQFSGNPAAVCLLPEARSDHWMQRVALEMNLSETAFLLPRPDGYGLRWFTPAAEVDLCGHATLASAHLLWEDGHLAPGETARFHTRSGPLSAVRDEDWIWMDFPAQRCIRCELPRELGDALGLSAHPRFVGHNGADYLVELASPQAVRELDPEFGALRRVDARGVIVTAQSDDSGHDFVSRFFAPAVGVNEDPVTGSAHCALAPYWAARLGRKELTGYQASERGGIVRVEDCGDRVRLGGQAVTVLRGELLAGPEPAHDG